MNLIILAPLSSFFKRSLTDTLLHFFLIHTHTHSLTQAPAPSSPSVQTPVLQARTDVAEEAQTAPLPYTTQAAQQVRVCDK